MNWINKRFGDCAELIRSSVKPEEATGKSYIGLEHISQGQLSLIGFGKSDCVISQKFLFKKGDILFGKLRPYFRKVIIAPFDGVCSTDIWVVRAKQEIDQRFLFYWMASSDFVESASMASEGTKMPRAQWEFVSRLEKEIPGLSEQRAIAEVLSSLDDKIELNRRMNVTIEELAKTLFNHWFIKDGDHYDFEEKPLDEIAVFLNGLALQKFPPNGNEYLPVVKIAQLRKNNTSDADKASIQLDPDYVVNDGDVLFSWSGSLEVVIWCGGKGALNQHLFKVTSIEFPKWFYYFWIKHHLKNFQSIASGKATTMGHIQRHHLNEARVLIPEKTELIKMNEIMDPLINKMIGNNIQSRTLAELRDMLLPKLMSGQVRVKGFA